MAPPTLEKDTGALRCHCGSLLARLVREGVEIKCRRCKRKVVISLGDSVGGGLAKPCPTARTKTR